MSSKPSSTDLTTDGLSNLLHQVAQGNLQPEHALDQLQSWHSQVYSHNSSSTSSGIGHLGFAQVDLDRLKRRGVGEVVFGQGKTAPQLLDLLIYLTVNQGKALATRVSKESGIWLETQLQRIKENQYDISNAHIIEEVHLWQWSYNPSARCFYVYNQETPTRNVGRGTIAVVSAGTSDGPVADEVECVLTFLGHKVDRINDVGVAGLHRILNQLDRLQRAEVLVVCAGMEGALASVAAGLVDVPVIAVPTSVGYGANFQGVTTLLSMLNSCAAGVAVVNIDNGFGAAYLAAQINRNRSISKEDING